MGAGDGVPHGGAGGHRRPRHPLPVLTCPYVLLLAGAAGLYWLNRLWLRQALPGPAGLFCRCWLADVLAGVILPALVSLLLLAARRPPLPSPAVLLLTLAAGGVWEGLSPLWKPGAVFDPLDFAAYLAGGAALSGPRKKIGKNP